MSTLSVNRPSFSSQAHSTPASSGWLHNLFTSALTEWRAHQAVRAVESLSDAALHDIGIARSEISDAVRHGRGSRY